MSVFCCVTAMGIDGLEITKTWLKTSLEKLQAENAAKSEAGGTTVPITPFTVLNNAYLSLLDWTEDQLFPEVRTITEGVVTLQYEYARLLYSLFYIISDSCDGRQSIRASWKAIQLVESGDVNHASDVQHCGCGHLWYQ